jgi:hypothetical protein
MEETLSANCNKYKEIRKKLKEINKEKKILEQLSDNFKDKIIDYIKLNKLDYHTHEGTKFELKKRTRKKGINKELISEKLSKRYGSEDAIRIAEDIDKSREETIVDDIKVY